MKQIIRPYILLLMTMFVASCTSEIPEENLPDALSEYEEGIIGIMPELIDGNNFGGSRNALTYDRTKKNMLFTWSDDASIGVFKQNSTINAGQQEFTIIPATNDGLRARFTAPEELEMKMDVSEGYISYSHFNSTFNPLTQANAYPVSFADQTAVANSKMYYYFTNDNDKFAEGEKLASQHLDAYDYLVAGGQPASVTNISLQFSRMESIVRFYLKSPAAEVYDSLQLVVVHSETPTPLIIKGKLNMETRTITGDGAGCEKNRVQTLKFNPGFDMTYTETREGHSDYPKSDYYYNTAGYIVTFMAMAPVDLTGADKIFLYLISHDGGTKKYYKSGDLAKPNLTPNLFYQWTSGTQNTDEPIEFQPVTVQVWKDDVLNNDGKGTEGW